VAARTAIERDWDHLGAGVPPALATRFRGALALLARLSSEPVASTSPVVAEAELPGLLAAAPTSPDPADAAAAASIPASAPIDAPHDAACGANDLHLADDAATAAAPSRNHPGHDRRDSARHGIDGALQRFADALDAGDTGAAQTIDAELTALMRSTA